MSDRFSIRRPRILWTLLAALIFVGVFPLVLSHYFLIGINRESLETLEKKYLTRSAVSVANDIQNLIQSHAQQLQKVAGGVESIASILPPGTDPFVWASETGVIRNFVSNDGDFLALRILNRAGQGARAETPGLGAAVTKEMADALTGVLGGKNYTGRFQWIDGLNQPAVVLAVPVTVGGKVIGGVVGVVSLQQIAERLKEEGKAEVTAYVVDHKGRVLIHTEPALTIQRPDYSSVPIVREFLKAPVRLTLSYDSPIDNVPMLGTVAPVGTPPWGVVVERQQAKAFASVARMIRATFQWGGIALLLAIAVGVVFATRISSPIRLLAQRTHEIAQGNYQERVEIRSRNEIGELAQDFNMMSEEIEKAIESLRRAVLENHQLFLNSIRMLAAAIDAKDPYTRGHSERVARISLAMGKHYGLDKKSLQNLRISALLHDVGKIGIDDRILRKPGALTDDEFAVMKTHPQKGAAIMSGVTQLADMIPGMKYHHERWAGGGYPEGIRGEEIPLQARIIAVADTFDAMTTNRPYQKAMDLSYVVEKIRGFGGTRFDPKVVEAFVAAVRARDIQPEETVRGAA